MTEFLGLLGFDVASDWSIFWATVIYTFAVVTVIWVIGLFQGNHSMMDGYYGFGFAVPAWIAYLASDARSAVAAAILVMASLYGCRLGWYLSRRWFGYRNILGGDQRYFGFREKLSPGYWWKSFFVVMEPQAVVLAVIGLPAVWGILGNRTDSGPLDLLAFAGIFIFGIGYYFETVADTQLQAFKADPHNKGRYLHTEVWKHTRHPNYFGNTLVWWGIWLVAISGNIDLWWTVAGPVFNTIMMTGVLGSAFQDKYLGSRPAYRQVMAETRGFFPWPVADAVKQRRLAEFERQNGN